MRTNSFLTLSVVFNGNVLLFNQFNPDLAVRSFFYGRKFHMIDLSQIICRAKVIWRRGDSKRDVICIAIDVHVALCDTLKW